MIKKINLVALLVIFASCTSTTYEDIEKNTNGSSVSYQANVKTIIDAKCLSCHSATGSASFLPLSTFANVKTAVQNNGLLNRIQLQAGQSGAMPPSGPIPTNEIQTIVKWNEQGLQE